MSVIFRQMANNLEYIILLAFFVTRLKIFKKLVTREKFDRQDKIILSIIFGGFGILGTYIGTNINGAIANTRIIGIMVGGILCGRSVGVGAGILAGAHRLAIDMGGITAIPCAITSIIAGYVAGEIHIKSKKEHYWFHGLMSGTIMESVGMGLILILSRPFEQALGIVNSIYVPMVLVNGIGMSLVISIVQSIFDEKEQIGAKQAKLVLEIANKTLPYFRNTDIDSLKKGCEIIMDLTHAKAVSIENREGIIVKVGMKEPKKRALESKIKESGEVIGALKIYYEREEDPSFMDVTLSQGISDLISTQIELGKIEKLREMKDKAEIKALQAQINPHFLFNALNTIVSFMRIDTSKARELIIDLSTYLRHNIENAEEVVPIEKEIRHTRAYVELEKARFKDKLEVEYNIPDYIKFEVPALIIQPLVENSIKHGILEAQRDHGKVTISTIEEIDKYIIVIEDDGIGIPLEIIEKLNSNQLPKNKIGLANVHRRLEIKYKKGLFIERLEEGTRIRFEIPKEVIKWNA